MEKLIIFNFSGVLRIILRGEEQLRYMIMNTNGECQIHWESSLSIGQGRRVNAYRPSASTGVVDIARLHSAGRASIIDGMCRETIATGTASIRSGGDQGGCEM
jgi:hypothetical protein